MDSRGHETEEEGIAMCIHSCFQLSDLSLFPILNLFLFDIVFPFGMERLARREGNNELDVTWAMGDGRCRNERGHPRSDRYRAGLQTPGFKQRVSRMQTLLLQKDIQNIRCPNEVRYSTIDLSTQIVQTSDTLPYALRVVVWYTTYRVAAPRVNGSSRGWMGRFSLDSIWVHSPVTYVYLVYVARLKILKSH